MKYFLVVGEASGDLHASNLMKALAQAEPWASFTFMGGPQMRAFGGTCVVRSEEVAFMGVVDVLRNLGTIKAAAQKVQAALVQEHPDVVICVDYAGFCFRYVLPFVRSHLPHTKVVYYIPPKVWAWKKHRIAKLRSHTHRVLTIFPFEVDYFRQNNLPQARYVGNPTMESVARYLATAPAVPHQAEPYIALVCGSRISEIRQNLPTMLRVAQKQATYWRVIAAAPGVEASIYHRIMAEVGIDATLVQDDTYGVIRGAKAALVTSGTATLETALLGTPQVVCYAMRGGKLPNWLFRHFFTIPYISLVNLIAGQSVVQELYGALFREERIEQALLPLLSDTPQRASMLVSYHHIAQLLHTPQPAATTAAQHIIALRS